MPAAADAHPSGHGPASLLDTAPHRVGTVSLTVRDLAGLVGFYREVIGLELLHGDAGSARLGTGAATLLELRHDPDARPHSARDAGLFHTAFLLPTRADLGAWLSHAADRDIALSGAADHIVSEAVYLSDPEGNGIEIYADRPSAGWPRADGMVRMRNDPLDRPALMRLAEARWTGLPLGGTVGHVHLQVGALPPAESFYADLLGFDITARYPGANFYGSGGYHHQLGTNTWNSNGAPVRPEPATGLAEIELLVTPDAFSATRTRFEGAGRPWDEGEVGITVRDPWGTRLRLTETAARGAA